MCGPLIQTVTLSSTFPGPYDSFTIIYNDGVELEPVVITVQTDDQEYALYEGRNNGEWRTKYNFKIDACW